MYVCFFLKVIFTVTNYGAVASTFASVRAALRLKAQECDARNDPQRTAIGLIKFLLQNLYFLSV